METSDKNRIAEDNKAAWDLMLSDPEGARLLAEATLSKATALGDEEGRAEALLNLGWCQYYVTRISQSIRFFKDSLAAFEALGDSLGLMKALNALGVANHDLGNFEIAMDFYTRSLEEARRRGNELREAVTLNNIGEVCLDCGDVKEGLDYFLRAYETIMALDDSELISNVLVNIGKSFLKMENWTLALDFLSKALRIAEGSGDRQLEAQARHGLGCVALANDQLVEAEAHFLEALRLCEGIGNEKWRVSALLELGSLDQKKGDLDLALERYRNALAGAEALGTKALLNQAFERLSEVHEALGNFQIALDYYRRHARFERESQSEDTSRKIKNVTVQYEVDKSRQEAEIYRLRNIELRQKTEALEELNSQLLSISELGRRITSSLDLDTVITTVKESLERHMDLSVFGLAVYIEEDDALDWKAYFDSGKRVHRTLNRLDPKRSIAAWSIRHRESVFIDDLDAEVSRYITGRPTGYGLLHAMSLAFLPLVIENRVIGILTVQSNAKAAYGPRHRVLLEALCPYIGIAMENGLIHDRLTMLNRAILGEKAALEITATRTSHLANHDSLTGLPNRRLLFELLQKSFSLADRGSTKVGTIFVDLDDFKPINDRHGHLTGDAVLVEVAARLMGCMRSSDTVARVGGDEFVIVLTTIKERGDTDLAIAKIAEAVSRPITVSGVECLVGLSMGVAIYPDDGISIEDILGRADSAMYQSKAEKKVQRTAGAGRATAGGAAKREEQRRAKGDRR